MSTTHPYFHRRARFPQKPSWAFSSCGDHIDLSNAHLPAYPAGDAVPMAQKLFDARAAAAVSTAVGMDGPTYKAGPVRIWPAVQWKRVHPKVGISLDPATMLAGAVSSALGFVGPTGDLFWARDLLELKDYGNRAPRVYLPTAKCLSALAYLDFFPDEPRIGAGLRSMVSGAVLAAGPGWCGTFGPGVDSTTDIVGGPTEGNYDMTQMHLVGMAYQYFDALSPEAREYIITMLLARGRIHRPNKDDTFTSGLVPNDWARAGYISPLAAHKDFGETENHILMIATARYLTNQLLFQRNHSPEHDNRRNSGGDWPSSTSLVLSLLRNILRDDFSEYNAKNYQEETRWALLNLCTYAYDHEVRLAARMVLDYISAHMAVSSNDLRRMVPFRRRNEGDNVLHDAEGWMTVGLLAGQHGPDPMSPYFAMQAGNTRAYEAGDPWKWGIKNDGTRVAMEVVSDYRLPPPVHDLFVNDAHRRFFQRLHRTPLDEVGGNRNVDNMEIFAGSPSYLITAGGSPSWFAIDPLFAGFVFGDQTQQEGVAVTTSFMPTGFGRYAVDLIQFGSFAYGAWFIKNYGVAPDFACGAILHLPDWVLLNADRLGNFLFVDRSRNDPQNGPGFYLAIYRAGDLALLEALDTWLHPGVGYYDFVEGVMARNHDINLVESQEFGYTTSNGNRLTAVIWNHADEHGWPVFGAEVTRIDYPNRDPGRASASPGLEPGDQDAGNVKDRFLIGTVMNSGAEAVVEITNRFLRQTITLDMSDPWHPRRTDEFGVVEQAGSNSEVWVDFDWPGPSEGDVCRPFNSIAPAAGTVADGGLIRIVPGTSTDRSTIGGQKRFRLVAPIGGVLIGAADPAQREPIAGAAGLTDPVAKNDVWVQFDFPESSVGNILGPCRTLAEAQSAVADDGVIRIVPGATSDRPTLGDGRRYRLVAPIGGVTIGARSDFRLPVEVWVDFDWPGMGDGGLCSPFKTIAVAEAAIAPNGTIDIMPSATIDRSAIGGRKPFRLVAPQGRVTIGARL